MSTLQETQEDRLHDYVGHTVIYRTTVMLYLQNQNDIFISFRPIASQQIPGIAPASDLVIGHRHRGLGYARERNTSTPIIMCKR